MITGSSQFDAVARAGMYEQNHQISIWNDSYKADSSQNTSGSTVVETDLKPDIGLEDSPSGPLGSLKNTFDKEACKPADKVLRRLAQNRESARKSRLRKKAYVQQLESSRVKLAQLEQELDRARNQGRYVGGHSIESSMIGMSANVSSVAFGMDYGHWVEVQNQHIHELRSALLQAQVSDIELRILVENGLDHYDELFRIKEIAAKADVFYLISGSWRTIAERFFLWIGGFRPSELLKVLTPQIEHLDEQQLMAVYSLQQSSQQGEDALSQGMDKLRQTLAENLTSDQIDASSMGNCMAPMANAMENLKALESFVKEADHLRQQTLQQMYKILTTRQAARGLLALGDYFQRLRALSSLWAARPREPV